MIDKALTGNRKYWIWLGLLSALAVAGLIAYLQQWVYGLGITGMSRSVSWGLYIANLTFLVGVAASAVIVVLPYYLHNQKEFGRLTAFGEFLAVSAVAMSIMFVLVDLGQPARAFNMILHPSPSSPLFWDMVVLSGYFILNLVIAWTTLDSHRKAEPPPAWLKTLALVSIPWAISIHTVTAFIYSGLAARPFWLTALMAPRFLGSAFASGPAILILICLAMRRLTRFDAGEKTLQKLAQIVTYTLLITLFLVIVEFFTTFYSQIPEHMAHLQYLYFGLNGHMTLVPWAWTSLVLAVLAAIILLNPVTRKRQSTLVLACVAVFISVWLEKGLGIVVPGFVPSPTGEIFDYWPTMPETLITIGVWAFGILLLTVLYKVAVSVWEEEG